MCAILSNFVGFQTTFVGGGFKIMMASMIQGNSHMAIALLLLGAFGCAAGFENCSQKNGEV